MFGRRWLFSPNTQLLGFILGALAVSLATLMPASSLGTPPGSDKLHHVLGFAFWAMLCAFGPTRRYLWLAFLITLCGGLIELIQPYVHRRGEWGDFWADCAGVGVATFLHACIRYCKRRGMDTA
ncbi:hypothetical protein MAQ5080_01651 [Marinomonas aquimarina]|uniref:VanZ like family protein n=1 Tax=Marinomonas aquimarina TaxID=295068 RepID=A0A1A8TDG6_9GAMM|nr:hypothetical protein [Marinomonas aquimarina]SBS30379.1 hypothetical protein MAQ5080_01651 [Marinomonas aquimarina]